MYIYTHTHIHNYIYIYILVRGAEGVPRKGACRRVNMRVRTCKESGINNNETTHQILTTPIPWDPLSSL